MRAKRWGLAWLRAATVAAAGLVTGPAAGVAAADTCQNWSGDQPANPAGTQVVNTLTGIAAVAQCDVWAVGYTQDVNIDGSNRALIEHWTDGSWAVTPAPPLRSDARLFGVSAVSASNVWAVGYTTDATTDLAQTLILHWDGTSWTRQPSPTPAGDNGLLLSVDALSASDVWAVGQSGNGPGEVPMTLHWDGTGWTQRDVPAPADGTHQVFSTVSGASSSDVWALGSTFGSPSTAVLYHWEGTAWAPRDLPPVANDELSSIDAVAANNLWVSGSLTNNGVTRTLMMHFDGSTWNITGVPNPGGSGFDNGLGAIASSSPSDIWVAGNYQKGSGGVIVPFALHYDGSNWAVANLPGPGGGQNDSIGAVTVSSPGQAWVAGAFIDNSRTYAAPVPAVPDVTGLSPSNAATALQFYGLAGPQALHHTTNCPGSSAGQIVGSDLAPGTREPFGTAVGLTECDLATVPNVVGLDDGSAQTAITAAGLRVGSVSLTRSCTVPAGNVMSQSIRAGTHVAGNTAVSLTESAGKGPGLSPSFCTAP